MKRSRWLPRSRGQGSDVSRCGRSPRTRRRSARSGSPRTARGSRGGVPLTNKDATEQVRVMVDAIYRSESRRVLATLIRLLGDFDIAEEALHDAFAAAVEQWPKDGPPANPRAWLVSTGRFKAIDSMRRRARFDASQ